MSVKKVFLRSMRVCIFAGALLVGETVCKIDQTQLIAYEQRVKQCSSDHMKLRFYLKFLQEKTLRFHDADELYIPKHVERVQSVLRSSKELYRNIKTLFVDLDKIYERDEEITVIDSLPEPYGPNVMRATRVKVFAEYLGELESRRWETTVKQLVEAGKVGSAPKLKTNVLELIAHLVSLPFIDDEDRYAHLPLNYASVSYEEVKETHQKMELKLRNYVKDVRKGLGKYTDSEKKDLVFVKLLKFEHNQVSNAIFNDLEFLYKRHRFYRLAASEAHIVNVEHYPGAFESATRLSTTIKKLNKFALLLSGFMHAFDSEGIMRGNFEKLRESLTEIASPKQLLKPHVVISLNKSLQLKLPDVSDLTSTVDSKCKPMVWGSRLLEEVEERFKFYAAYKKLRSVARKNSLVGEMNVTDFQFLVAFLDEKSQELNVLMNFAHQRGICRSVAAQLPPDWTFVRTNLDRLCKSYREIFQKPYARINSGGKTFYSLFEKNFDNTSLILLEESVLLDKKKAMSLVEVFGERFKTQLERVFTTGFEWSEMLSALDIVYSRKYI